MNSNWVTIAVRVPPSLRHALEELADRQRRSMGELMLELCENAVMEARLDTLLTVASKP